MYSLAHHLKAHTEYRSGQSLASVPYPSLCSRLFRSRLFSFSALFFHYSPPSDTHGLLESHRIPYVGRVSGRPHRSVDYHRPLQKPPPASPPMRTGLVHQPTPRDTEHHLQLPHCRGDQAAHHCLSIMASSGRGKGMGGAKDGYRTKNMEKRFCLARENADRSRGSEMAGRCDCSSLGSAGPSDHDSACETLIDSIPPYGLDPSRTPTSGQPLLRDVGANLDIRAVGILLAAISTWHTMRSTERDICLLCRVSKSQSVRIGCTSSLRLFDLFPTSTSSKSRLRKTLCRDALGYSSKDH